MGRKESKKPRVITAVATVPRVVWGRKRRGNSVRPWDGVATLGRGAAGAIEGTAVRLQRAQSGLVRWGQRDAPIRR